MPHLFTSRPRQYTLFNQKAFGSNQYKLELANGILYIVGGITFVVGSVCFLPKYENFFDTGAWIFFGGSLVYLAVTGQDLWESSNYSNSRIHKVQ
ncbi:MAG: hypothetical protein BRC33_06405 [Cyanobacteria bacterium SW_9_44_58]|nr:MAG: hypothetical protein BRC33_06405 [Cyanobacteria bacterium SW_9_44_58]